MNNFKICIVPDNYLYLVTKVPIVLDDEDATEYFIRVKIKDHADGEMTIHKGPDGEWKNYINSPQLFEDEKIRVLMAAINREESHALSNY